MVNVRQVERRAAEIVAMIHAEYPTGGWFAGMSPGEQEGWDRAEDAEWAPDGEVEPGSAWTPRNGAEWAGWLAFYAWTPYEIQHWTRVA